MKIIIESFNKLNDQARYCILVGVVFVIILLDVFFLVLPQMSTIADVNDQINKISEDTQGVLSGKQGLKQLIKSRLELRAQYGALDNRMRAIQEVPVILSDISSIANEYGVKIDQLVPEKEQQEVLKTPADVGKYYALPVVIKAHCGYHMFGRFLNKLEHENLCFTLKDFIIQNDDKDPNARLFSLTIKLILADRVPTSKI